MKKLLACLLLASTTALAHKIELVNKDEYMPFQIDNRISFFVTKEYTDNTIVPIGTQILFIVTVDCKQQLHRRSLIQIYEPSTKTIRNIFKNDDDIATSMREQSFSKIDPELLPITTQLCKTLIK
jgi:hypothetical protein